MKEYTTVIDLLMKSESYILADQCLDDYKGIIPDKKFDEYKKTLEKLIEVKEK